MIITILVVTRLQDNGDGGYTMYVYNSEDELIADHPKCSTGKVVDGKYVKTFDGCSDELRDEILNEEDPYENGYIENSMISIKQNKDGSFELAEPLVFHAGQ